MRRVILCLMLTAVLVIPAAAQDRLPVPDIVRYADYAPGDAAVYAAIRMDSGFRDIDGCAAGAAGAVDRRD